jgi:hypothetical protein
VDSFGGTSLAWTSMGLEAHRGMPTACMPDERDETLEA